MLSEIAAPREGARDGCFNAREESSTGVDDRNARWCSHDISNGEIQAGDQPGDYVQNVPVCAHTG